MYLDPFQEMQWKRFQQNTQCLLLSIRNDRGKNATEWTNERNVWEIRNKRGDHVHANM